MGIFLVLGSGVKVGGWGGGGHGSTLLRLRSIYYVGPVWFGRILRSYLPHKTEKPTVGEVRTGEPNRALAVSTHARRWLNADRIPPPASVVSLLAFYCGKKPESVDNRRRCLFSSSPSPSPHAYVQVCMYLYIRAGVECECVKCG